MLKNLNRNFNMNLKVLGSSSHGNCYILQNNREALIIEAGISMVEIKKAVDFNISKISGCIITHEHLDHAKYVNQVLDSSITVYLSAGTNSKLKYAGQRFPLLAYHGNEFKVGRFRILPFNIKHDCEEPIGYLINHPETGTILFATDTFYIPNKFRGMNHIIIEANYAEDILEANIRSGCLHPIVRNRIVESHMSIETCKEFLKANDISNVQNILLIHLSDGNSDAGRFKNEIEGLTGKRVFIGEPGLEMAINKSPF